MAKVHVADVLWGYLSVWPYETQLVPNSCQAIQVLRWLTFGFRILVSKGRFYELANLFGKLRWVPFIFPFWHTWVSPHVIASNTLHLQAAEPRTGLP